MTVSFTSKVKALEERFDRVWVHELSKEAVFSEVSCGWSLHLEGSWESLFVGVNSQADLAEGDKVIVTITKIDSK
jgi:hypothetical protein